VALCINRATCCFDTTHRGSGAARSGWRPCTFGGREAQTDAVNELLQGGADVHGKRDSEGLDLVMIDPTVTAAVLENLLGTTPVETPEDWASRFPLMALGMGSFLTHVALGLLSMSITAMLCQRPHFFQSRLANTRPQSAAVVFNFAHLDELAIRGYDCYRWQFPELIVGVDPDGE
jgi:hypothetical protein